MTTSPLAQKRPHKRATMAEKLAELFSHQRGWMTTPAVRARIGVADSGNVTEILHAMVAAGKVEIRRDPGGTNVLEWRALAVAQDLQTEPRKP